MCLYEYKSRLPYGVIDTDKNDIITAWREKPEITSNINTEMLCYGTRSISTDSKECSLWNG